MRARDAAAKANDEAAANTTAAQALLDASLARIGQLSQSLDAALAELDAPLSKISNVMIEEFEHGWRPAWLGDPAAIRALLAGLADAWATHAAELVRCQQAASELAHQKASTQAARDRVQADLLASASEHDRLGEAISVLREQRLQLFEGRAVAEVEQALQARQQAAADRHTAASASAAQAAEQAGLAQATLNNANEAVARHAADLQAARTAVAEWISAHAGTTEECLARLLAHSAEWVREERALLARIDQERASAQAVLKERLAQLAQHRSQAQPGPLLDEASCRAALAGLAAERDTALAQAAQLRRALDQDDLRRASAQSLQDELERQQLEERRWARMNELIGSSDGKKFRNYAQQFTLDVLLGYANAHLQQLARRYRLERVASANGPSLGLMVRDQDMGGEIRSVNSLSGGESFLVSLALALGLASLSSNRVKVESLFIDEGFGSLDSDTLRVAMEALDGLQASGRRVGVISHVQEMTERIAVRIMVVPTGGGGSAIRI
jgi:exonuclease SbcC